ncbi:hypothetical protein EB093_01270 [bacterium]|nr:hypothetical protein [bacterium]
MYDIDPFRDKIKPTFLPPRVDPRAQKRIEADDVHSFYGLPTGESFEKTADQIGAAIEKNYRRLAGDARSVDDVSSAAERIARQVMGQRQISKIYEGLSLLPQNILANADQINDTFNYERVKDSDYVYLPSVLKPQYDPSGSKESIEEQVYSQRFYELVGQDPADQSTSPHNLNLFHGMGSNPFKEGDSTSFETFQKSQFFSALHKQSMTPRNILEKLDPHFWQIINDGVDSISATDFRKLSQDQLKLIKNPYGNAHFGLNWEGVSDPFQDNKFKTFDISANFHTIVSSQLWKTWDQATTFAFVNRLWEASTRVDDVLREIIGKASNAPVSDELAKSLGKTPGDFVETNAARNEQMVKHVDDWWQRVGKGLNEAEVLPFGLLASFAPLMQTMKDWGNWADSIEAKSGINKGGDTFGFKEQMISSYVNHSLQNYVFKKFAGNNKLTPALVGGGDEKLGESQFRELQSCGYLDVSGHLTDKFDPSKSDFELQVGFSSGEKARVRDVLRQASVGAFSLDIQDQALIFGVKRSNIRVASSDGKLRTLPELLDMLKAAETPYDQVKNAQIVYNTLFNMHSAMTGLDQSTSSDGKPLLSMSGIHAVMPVSNDGSWRELNKAGEWITQTGPVKLTFNNADDAIAFKDQIRILMALLEPVVGTFGPDVKHEGGQVFRMLVDNSGSADTVAMITEGAPNYKLTVDTLYDTTFFDSDMWKKISDGLQNRVVNTVAYAMFGRNAINASQREGHKKKVSEYEEAKDEYEISEITRVLKEIERMVEERKLEQKRIQESREAILRQEAEANRSAQQNRERERAEERARRRRSSQD